MKQRAYGDILNSVDWFPADMEPVEKFGVQI